MRGALTAGVQAREQVDVGGKSGLFGGGGVDGVGGQGGVQEPPG